MSKSPLLRAVERQLLLERITESVLAWQLAMRRRKNHQTAKLLAKRGYL